MTRLIAIVSAAAGAFLLWASTAALAGEPKDFQYGFQKPASTIMQRVDSFHDLLLYIITAISVFVLVLLLYVMIRFREKANPTPSKTTHNTLLEVVWTAVPVMILALIAVFSFPLLYYLDGLPRVNAKTNVASDRFDKKLGTPGNRLYIKAIGRQWKWDYVFTFKDADGSTKAFRFTADPLCQTAKDCQAKAAAWEKETGRKPLRLLDTDNPVVLPVNTTIIVQITGADVIHSWAMPSFGVKADAVPGRLNQLWFRVVKTGWYFGQCSEICGAGHAYMPISVKVVSKEDFEAWRKQAWEWAQKGERKFRVEKTAPNKTAAK